MSGPLSTAIWGSSEQGSADGPSEGPAICACAASFSHLWKGPPASPQGLGETGKTTEQEPDGCLGKGISMREWRASRRGSG